MAHRTISTHLIKVDERFDAPVLRCFTSYPQFAENLLLPLV